MSALPFKQCKVIWYLIILKADIQTIGRIFSTSHENKELSEDGTLWISLCLRDFFMKGNKNDYISWHKFGSHFEYKPCYMTVPWKPQHGLPKYISVHSWGNFVTYSTTQTDDLHIRIGEKSLATYKYRFTEDHCAFSERDICKKVLHIEPTMKWLIERFYIESLQIDVDRITFIGIVKEDFIIIRSCDGHIITSKNKYHNFIMTYQGEIKCGEEKVKILREK